MAAPEISSRQWATSLINAIPSTSGDCSQISNPLRDLSPEGRNILLTLYALFEKEFLPALDLLDRNLISRLTVHSQPEATPQQARSTSLYIVRSAQQHNHRNPHYERINYYEVRLEAWSCSCPAFTFSAFPTSTPEDSDLEPSGERTELSGQSQWLFGGLTRGDDMPVCKHLLACVLVERCSVFSHFVQERQVSLHELGGWSAGWGD